MPLSPFSYFFRANSYANISIISHKHSPYLIKSIQYTNHQKKTQLKPKYMTANSGAEVAGHPRKNTIAGLISAPNLTNHICKLKRKQRPTTV